ncbi:hypothetical protein BGX28_003775 [Mortierella sp. GBA30]|nr:hypothetical protein BGX28_003775 [Mortierella sp. GBA30]
MLNLDAGTIKRKIDSNEYDDEIIQEVQPNGKRTCSLMTHSNQFATFGGRVVATPHTPNNGQENNIHSWPASQSNPSPLHQTAIATSAQIPITMSSSGFMTINHGYQTPESGPSSVTASPFDAASSSSMDMDMESTSATQETPAMIQSTNAVLNTATACSMATHSSGLLPSALPGQPQQEERNEYVPVHGRSMEIPSYARVPLSEIRKYRDQRWSSCIYGADTRIGQGMML